MSVTLTVDLDADVLQLAEQEAKARHTTLPEVVAHQLRVMARNWQESKAGKTPVTDGLIGVVKLPPLVTVGGGGLTDEFKNAPSEKIRDAIYRGHGA